MDFSIGIDSEYSVTGNLHRSVAYSVGDSVAETRVERRSLVIFWLCELITVEIETFDIVQTRHLKHFWLLQDDFSTQGGHGSIGRKNDRSLRQFHAIVLYLSLIHI